MKATPTETDPTAPVFYSVIVPFYNEEECIPGLLAELREVMPGVGKPYELVLIDDASTDSTRTVLEKIAGEWDACRVVSFPKNSGQAAGLYYGLRCARGSVLILLDGDGQNAPQDIPAMLDALGDADLVVGYRVDRDDSALRLAMSRFANGIRSRILRDGVRDSGCGLKVMRRRVVESIVPIRTLYSFIPAMVRSAGFKIVEQPVSHRPRTLGVSKYGFMVFLWRPLLDMLGMWWFTRRRIPATPFLKPSDNE